MKPPKNNHMNIPIRHRLLPLVSRPNLLSLTITALLFFASMPVINPPTLAWAQIESQTNTEVSLDTDATPIRDERETEALREFLASVSNDSFSYKREGRHDPFLPFVQYEIVKAAAPEGKKEEKKEILTGLQKFEPGQLNLVTILLTEKEPLAMVEDSIGKGYVVRRGTKIGQTGIVDEIVPNKVVIKQLAYYTMKKEKIYKTYEMVLRKEGEK